MEFGKYNKLVLYYKNEGEQHERSFITKTRI